jgi:hypothetical protein
MAPVSDSLKWGYEEAKVSQQGYDPDRPEGKTAHLDNRNQAGRSFGAAAFCGTCRRTRAHARSWTQRPVQSLFENNCCQPVKCSELVTDLRYSSAQ